MSEAAKKLDTPQDVVTEFAKYSHFVRVLLDAYAVIDASGKVVKANQLFAQLTGVKMRQLLKTESFNELIEFSVNDDRISVENLLEFESPIRIDEVRGQTPNSEETKNLIVGFYPFFNEDRTQKLGAFIIMRDVTAETNLQDQYKDKAIQSITDPLTGLFTRAYFEEYLTSQVSRIEKKPEEERYPVSIVMCDIDFFKKVNDQYGHQAGDYVLKVVADLMKKTFRKTDVCCRYGGEEFLVILPAANPENAGQAADKLRHAVENAKIVFEDTHIPVTLSCGISTIAIGSETYDVSMGRADAALYDSKKNGRNLVSVHDGEKIHARPRLP
ncbi:MAG: sensor domain-containing diguanylate cyclase [Pseudobacteriovorax sp.]|nr:sensor domain-containing diguanylate cyclase [Pseudobacteriovorax sp.]